MIRLSACIGLLALCAACDRHRDDPDSYFPLEPGLGWTYRITTEIGGRQTESQLVEHNDGIVQIDGLPHTERVTDQGTRYYVREDQDGVYRAAKRTIVEIKPQPDDPPRWILRRPYEVGSNWSQESHPYVLRRLHPYEAQLAGNIQFKMSYQIGALGETVEVPAGRFEGCIRVDGDALLSLYADARTGYRDIEINTREWYAPGVGLVKLVRTEPHSSDVFGGGKITLALERFKR